MNVLLIQAFLCGWKLIKIESQELYFQAVWGLGERVTEGNDFTPLLAPLELIGPSAKNAYHF